MSQCRPPADAKDETHWWLKGPTGDYEPALWRGDEWHFLSDMTLSPREASSCGYSCRKPCYQNEAFEMRRAAAKAVREEKFDDPGSDVATAAFNAALERCAQAIEALPLPGDDL